MLGLLAREPGMGWLAESLSERAVAVGQPQAALAPAQVLVRLQARRGCGAPGSSGAASQPRTSRSGRCRGAGVRRRAQRWMYFWTSYRRWT
ncbi:unnamed protein product [Caretta caretta]